MIKAEKALSLKSDADWEKFSQRSNLQINMDLIVQQKSSMQQKNCIPLAIIQ
jgi:hypothetical protein